MESARPYAGVDTRYVYGARCTWHGPISAIGRRPITTLQPKGNYQTHSMPCCPHCSGVLFEYETKAEWDAAVAKYDLVKPGYADFVVWLGTYGRCWPSHKDAAEMYKLATGKDFSLASTT